MRLLPLVLTLALLAAGCGGDDGEEPHDPGGDEVLVEFSRGGGIAFSFEELAIETDGKATLSVGPSPDEAATRRVELEPGELSAIEDAVAAAELDEVGPGVELCADCYEYSIATAKGEATFDSAGLGDPSGTVPESVRELLAELTAISERYAPPAPEPLGAA